MHLQNHVTHPCDIPQQILKVKSLLLLYLPYSPPTVPLGCLHSLLFIYLTTFLLVTVVRREYGWNKASCKIHETILEKT